MTELWQLGALELAATIRAGEASSREIMEAHLARIEAVNPALNAVVRLLDGALEQADEADAAVAAGRDLGPLHGVPCTIKDNIDVAGDPTTQGVAALEHAVAPLDAPTTARMRAAGAIPFARTNLPDFGLRVHTDSQLHGLTKNPWNPSVTAGGSSGGEASALASGMSPIGLGNDIGGSLRNPAHCCGIASLKPSAGVIPMATSIEPIDMPLGAQQMEVEGPMARCVADVRAATRILSGPHPRDPRSLPVNITDADFGNNLKVGVLAEPPGGTTDPGIAAAIRDVGVKLSHHGHEVVEVVPPDYETVMLIWAQLLIADSRSQIDDLRAKMGPDGLALLDGFDQNLPPSEFPDVHRLHEERFRLMREWSSFFAETPVLICPVWAEPAFTHGADLDRDQPDLTINTIRPVLAANLLGLPAAVTPAGMSNGLPVGVQVMGDRFTDHQCLTIAAEIEGLVGRFTPIDPITE